MLNTLKTLCALNGVSGDEGEVREYIMSRAKAHATELFSDAMGNLIAFKKGKKTPDKKIMLCAHMDEVGVIVTRITDEGFLKFACIGGIDRRVIIGKPVYIGKERVFGLIANRAIHLVKPEDREKAPQVDELYIDIGAKNREEAEKRVARGDTGAFDGQILEFGDGFVKAKAIDDRLGCAVLLHLLESDLPVDCWFAFTTQEEVGMRGAYGAAFKVAPDIALIVEGTTAADLPSVKGEKKVCCVGKGAVIPFMDGATIYDRDLYKMLTQLAEKNDIPWQTKTFISGGTDGAAVQRSRAGVKTAGIAAPIRNLHSPACVGKSSDFDHVLKLAGLFLEEMANI